MLERPVWAAETAGVVWGCIPLLPPANAKQPPKPAVGPRPAGTVARPPAGFLGKVVDLRRRNQILCRVRKWLRVPVIGPGPAPHPGHHFLPKQLWGCRKQPGHPGTSAFPVSPFTFCLSPFTLAVRAMTSSPLPSKCEPFIFTFTAGLTPPACTGDPGHPRPNEG